MYSKKNVNNHGPKSESPLELFYNYIFKDLLFFCKLSNFCQKEQHFFFQNPIIGVILKFPSVSVLYSLT